jgi:spermidine/putrescine transport system substrate-binding protein
MDRHTRTQLDIWAEALWQERLTRRAFVRRGIALGVASSLLAEIVGPYTRDVAAETGPAPPVLERIKKEGKRLFVYNWEDYVHPNTIPKFRNTPFDPGNAYTVPYGWGMTGLASNATYTKDDPHLGSWALVFESGAQRYSGKLGFTDEREEVMAAALQYLGHHPNTRTKDALRQAGELLLRLKPHIKAFYPGAEMKKALITEDVVVAQSWNGEAVKARAKNPAVIWGVPKEGGTGWFDTMAIPKVAPHKFTAEVFMNYMLRPEVAADNSNTTGYATTNQVAVEKYIDPQVASNSAVYPPAETLARVTFLEHIPDDLLPFYEDIWTRILGA